jgi:hypothetical protein
MSTDADRRELFVALEQSLGSVPAATLMELLPPVGWADVARRSDVEALRADLDAQGVALRGEMAELRGSIAKLDAKIDGLFARLLVANVPLMLGIAALVLAAVKLG